MSAAHWIAMHCGDETAALLANHPNAFLLLAQVAMRARWKDCPITGMKAGEAFLGDYELAGLKTEAEYRHAKKVLLKCALATFRATNKGTVATLATATIFSFSEAHSNDQSNRPTAGQQQASNRPATTNHKDTRTQGTLDIDSPSPAGRPGPKARGTLDELKAYALQIGMEAGDGETCFHSWEGNGWTNNGKSVKDWKATMNAWKGKGYLASQKRQAPGHPGTAPPPPPGTVFANGQTWKT